MDNLEFHAGMKKHFGITNAGRFYDLNAVAMRETKIDLIQFDDYLHEKHGDYEETKPEGVSMSDFISSQYGEPARAFILSLI